RPVQAHASLGAHQRSRPVGKARGRPAGAATGAGLGVHPLRTPGAGVVRGMDLSTRSASSADPAVTSRLRHLHQLLQQRVRRGIDVAPPLLRAGVLIPLIRRGNGVELLFTRRTDTVLTHKGQISFPGGQQEERDVETVETALRESYEEIGLEPSRVTVLG